MVASLSWHEPDPPSSLRPRPEALSPSSNQDLVMQAASHRSTAPSVASTIQGSALILVLGACAPQQTHIVTEIHRPDGTVERYTNMSSGFGYNPNATSNVNIGGVQGTSSAPTMVESDLSPSGYPWPPLPTPWFVPWGCGSFNYAVPPACTPGAAPMPVNLDVYGWVPGLR
jgi:hypothetical protein